MDNPHPLFAPAQLGPVQVKNRIVMASMTTRHADKEGHATPESLAYYRARAKGGVGLITVEMAAPEKVGRHRHHELGLYDDRFLDGLKQIVDVIHAEGAKASIQIGHGGGHTRRDICGEDPIAPSAVLHSVHEGHTEIIRPEAMTLARIKETQVRFVEAALRARAAGFDAVEIHGAHGYLLSQFLSDVENTRSDSYGGSLDNRARFSLEIIAMVKQALPDRAVIFRMNADDFFSGGLTLTDAVSLAQWSEQAGADAIHVTAGHYRSQPSAVIMIPPMNTGKTPFRHFSKAVKAHVRIPVISVGRYGLPEDAKDAFDQGDADFIALGRPLLADPDWVAKAKTGLAPKPCLACNTCVDGMRDGQKLHCLVNPRTGREVSFSQHNRVMDHARIAVIGAGPAGLSFAAEMADTNTVVIFEKQHSLGGAFQVAGYAPKFQNVEANPDAFQIYTQAMEKICRRKGVVIKTGIDVVQHQEELRNFDWIVVATGAQLPFGLQNIVDWVLKSGHAKHGIFGRLMGNEKLRSFFYYRARKSTGQKIKARLQATAKVSIIGDAVQSGKAADAIKSAYALAYSSEGKFL